MGPPPGGPLHLPGYPAYTSLCTGVVVLFFFTVFTPTSLLLPPAAAEASSAVAAGQPAGRLASWPSEDRRAEAVMARAKTERAQSGGEDALELEPALYHLSRGEGMESAPSQAKLMRGKQLPSRVAAWPPGCLAARPSDCRAVG